jgi:uncharacterized protein (DUF302 family)
MGIALPYRIFVYQEGGTTRIGMIRPTALLALFPGAAARKAAEEVARETMTTIDEAR